MALVCPSLPDHFPRLARWRLFQDAALEKAAQIRGAIVSTRIRRALPYGPDLCQFRRRFPLPAQRAISLSQLPVRLDKVGTLADGRSLPFYRKRIIASGKSDSAGQRLNPRVRRAEVGSWPNRGLRGVLPRRTRVKVAVGQIEIGLGTARAWFDRRFQRVPRLFVKMVSMQNHAVRQPDGGPLRPAILNLNQQMPGIVGLPGKFE